MVSPSFAALKTWLTLFLVFTPIWRRSLSNSRSSFSYDSPIRVAPSAPDASILLYLDFLVTLGLKYYDAYCGCWRCFCVKLLLLWRRYMCSAYLLGYTARLPVKMRPRISSGCKDFWEKRPGSFAIYLNDANLWISSGISPGPACNRLY